MRTVVLDDDPTGTQSASGVDVVFGADYEGMLAVLAQSPSVYVQTNSRAIAEDEAIKLVTAIRDVALRVGSELGHDIQFVLRGDSTLRGHVFPESAVFEDPETILLFVPAFPAGGRTTEGGVHYVQMGNTKIPAAQTEYADDPVFPFSSSNLVDYVAEKTGREAVLLDRQTIESSEGVARLLLEAPSGTVVVADASTDSDINRIAEGVRTARAQGRRLVIRSAAPLAAELAHASSQGLLALPLMSPPPKTLVVCGSHTSGASSQLLELAKEYGDPIVIATDKAYADPIGAGAEVAGLAKEQIALTGIAIIASERERRTEDNTLAHGERIMTAITAAVAALADDVGAVITKGGITSAQVAEVGLGVRRAKVVGQILPGVSVWKIPVAGTGREILDIIVPGNVGDETTLVKATQALGW